MTQESVGLDAGGDYIIPIGRWWIYPNSWDDLRVPLNAVKLGGVADPSWAQWRDNGSGSTGVFAYQFAKNAVNEVFLIAQLPHSYAEGTDLRPHLHWGTQSTKTTGDVVFGLEWTLAGKDEAFATTTVDEVTVSVTENIQYKEQIDGFTDIPGTTSGGVKISDVIIARLYRKGNDAADTFDDPVFVFEFDIHFQSNSNGTEFEFVGKPR